MKTNTINKNNLISNNKNCNKIINNKYNNNLGTYEGNKKVFHLFDNVDLTKRKSDGLMVNRCTYFNVGYYYNINIYNTPPFFVYYNNPLMINRMRTYTNNMYSSSQLRKYI